ncbi:sensor histidine kinase [Flammeovirgaceae bacterium SG7u.111]|nr:sensor histidine kinase [Flammeovirgaceae bacterium SG7u.132]WPO36548.1 sensor histidine kinase [Flammeovirgaceae bacterium SG7u.111]
MTLILHLLVWGIVFSMPFLSNDKSPKDLVDYMLRVNPLLFFAFIFYVNYFYLIKKVLFAKKVWVFLLINLGINLICLFFMDELRVFYESLQETEPNRRGPGPLVMFLTLFIACSMTTGISVAIKITNEWLRTESERKEIEKEKLTSEILNLKNQLNPHFFFNTLNNIYSLIIQDQDKAQDAVYQLSKLMRYLLYDSDEQYVSLEREIHFMKHYIDLMKLRVSDNVRVEHHFPENVTDYKVAPLLFISLIENSFKHGVNPSDPSEIYMDMRINENEELVFNIKNTSYPKKDNDRSGSGIGLENIEKRLKLLYPDKHTFEIEDGKKYFECKIALSLSEKNTMINV